MADRREWIYFMTRLETLKNELEAVRNFKTLAFTLKANIIAYYENEIRAIEVYNAGNPEYDEGKQND